MLNRKTRYLQVALNSTLNNAREIIAALPASERILIEAGTPFIKRYGEKGVRQLVQWWEQRLSTKHPGYRKAVQLQELFQVAAPLRGASEHRQHGITAYIVADLKTMDRGETEVQLAADAGASAVVALGHAPIETLDALIENCQKAGLDAMIDMMNVSKPSQVLRKLQKLPRVVMLHRGVDEERFSGKPYPIHLINKVKGAFDVLVSVAGGDTPREIQSAVFNGADICVLWKDFYQAGGNTAEIAKEFLQEIR